MNASTSKLSVRTHTDLVKLEVTVLSEALSGPDLAKGYAALDQFSDRAWMRGHTPPPGEQSRGQLGEIRSVALLLPSDCGVDRAHEDRLRWILWGSFPGLGISQVLERPQGFAMLPPCRQDHGGNPLDMLLGGLTPGRLAHQAVLFETRPPAEGLLHGAQTLLQQGSLDHEGDRGQVVCWGASRAPRGQQIAKSCAEEPGLLDLLVRTLGEIVEPLGGLV